MYDSYRMANLEFLSRRSFQAFGFLKNPQKSFQICFHKNRYFLSDELFCKNHFYIFNINGIRNFSKYTRLQTEYHSESFSIHPHWHVRFAYASTRQDGSERGRMSWKEDKIRKSPDGTGTVRNNRNLTVPEPTICIEQRRDDRDHDRGRKSGFCKKIPVQLCL